jgi:predicted Zn-dependent peptidase
MIVFTLPGLPRVSAPILSHVFPNGLALLAQPMDWLQSAAFSFLVPAGCVHEPAARLGLATFTCEMTLRGAGPRDNRQFVLDLDNLGVEHHAAVSSARVSYGGATLAENLPAGLTIFADVLRSPHLPAEELEACRQNVLQSLRSVADEPATKAMIVLRRRHFPEPWGRSSLGEQEALETIGLDEIRRFFQRHFQPRGTILGVAGRVEWEPLKDLVGTLLGDWQPAEEATFDEVPAPGGYLHVPYDSAQTHIGIAYASVPYRHPDYFQASGAVGALGRGMSSRLFTEVRERRGLCYSVYASYHTLRDRAGVFCFAGSSTQRAQETLDVTLGEVRRLAQGIQPGELKRLKARAKTELIIEQESSFSRSLSMAAEWYHIHRARTLDELERIVDGLTCESINEYLAGNPPGPFTIVTVGPQELQVRD